MPDVNVLEIERLTCSFRGINVLDGVTMSVTGGEIRGLIGPNGAGKTTLLNVITGIYSPTGGSIRFYGESIVGLRPDQIALKGLLRTFQVPRLFGNMSVLDNLLLPFYAHARYRQSLGSLDGLRRADELLVITRLDRLRHTPAKYLSGGQQALLQIARAFMIDGVRLYLLDEPFAGVNPVIRDIIIDLIVHMNQERGVTVLIVSHEMEVVRQLCRRVSVMVGGRVIAEGSMEEIASNEYVINAYLGRREGMAE